MKNLNPKQEEILDKMLDIMTEEGFFDGLDIMEEQLDKLVEDKTITSKEADEIASSLLKLFMGMFG